MKSRTVVDEIWTAFRVGSRIGPQVVVIPVDDLKLRRIATDIHSPISFEVTDGVIEEVRRLIDESQ